MNKAYEVADRLMEWVSSLLHRITESLRRFGIELCMVFLFL